LFLALLYSIWSEYCWDNWPLRFPKPIFGKRGIFLQQIPLINFDWRPAQEPYDIGEWYNE